MANVEAEQRQREEKTPIAGVFDNLERARRRWVTVEPVVSLGYVGVVVFSIVVPFYLQSRLSEELYNITVAGGEEYSICAGNDTDDDEIQAVQDDIQAQTSLWMLYLFAVASFPLIVTSVILGTLSDRVGRKMCIVVPLVGWILQESVYLAVIYFQLPLEILFVGEFCRGMSGGFGLFYAGCSSYVVDITSETNRNLRLAVVEMIMTLIGGVVQIGVGFMADYINIMAPILLAIGANIICLIYVVTPGILIETVDRKNASEHRTGLKEAGMSVVKLLKFNEKGRRWQLLLLNLFVFFVYLNVFTAASIYILYGTASPFCWEAVSASIASAFLIIVVSIGLVGGTKVFEMCLGDYWIMQISCLSLLAFNVVMALSRTTWLIYLASILGTFQMMSTPIARSVISQIVDPSEIGAAFSLVGCLDNVSVFVASIMGTGIYAATVRFLPQTVFYVCAGMCAIPASIVVVLQLFWPRSKTEQATEEHEDGEGGEMGGHDNEGLESTERI